MSALKIKELREKRLKLVSDARSIMDSVKKENRDLTTDEATKVDKLFDESDAVKKELEPLEASEQRRLRLAESETELAEARGRRTEADQPGAPTPDKRGAVEINLGKDYRTGRDRIMRFDPGNAAHRHALARCSDEHVAAYRGWMRGEKSYSEVRALQTDLDTAGGFLVAPETFLPELLKDLDDMVHVRKIARRFVVQSLSLGVPTRQAKLSSAAWGQELTAPTADSALKFGKRAITPHYMTSEILVSRDLMRSAVMDPESIVIDELSRDAGELEEQAFMTGSGAQRPLGIFTASNDGIDTSRDVSTDNTTTAFTMDGLINALHHIKGSYRSRASWMFHRTAIRNIRKLKDGAGQYIWQPSTNPNQPDTLLSRPIIESEWCPSTFTTGLYVGIIGDFNFYWIVDAMVMEMQRLVEKYAETNQDAFIVRRKVDGAPVRAEAFARVKLA